MTDAVFERLRSDAIEGTEVSLSEALSLVKANKPPPGREADGPDVLGTLPCAAGPLERRR